MRLLCLTRYGPLAPSSRMRAYQYGPAFAEAGLVVEQAPLLGDEYVRGLFAGHRRLGVLAKGYARRAAGAFVPGKHERILLEKEAFPWLPHWTERFALGSIPYVLDLDDAVFHNYDLHRQPWVRRALAGKIERLMAGAAVVSAGNDYLAQRARDAGAARVAVVPTSVDIGRYGMVPAAENARFTIGWIGTPVTQGYLRPIAGALRHAAQRLGARVVLVGATAEAQSWFPCEIRPWREATEVAELQAFDVGVMPLPDAPWERGKCGYKLIQSMACGRPTVASPVGVNVMLAQSGACGLLAATEAEWIAAFTTLAGDSAMRREMGDQARRLVEQRYSTAVNGPRLARIVRDLEVA